MAEALCGPSNPLQNFGKHAATDRTLQQDRLSSRLSPAQGFRSSPANHAGQLDSEFEAFAAGHSSFPEPFLAHHGGGGFSPAPLHPYNSPQATPDWAADFQRFNISSSTPIQHHSPLHAGWHQDFARQQITQPPPQQQPQIKQSSFQPVYNPPIGHHQPMSWNSTQAIAPDAYSTPFHPLATADSAASTSQLDSQAFEREFLLHDTIPTSQDHAYTSRISAELERKILADDSSTAEDIRSRIASLHDAYRDERDAELDQPADPLALDTQDSWSDSQIGRDMHDQTELAATAAELLDRVSGDTSRKFQESSFLALMRRLRDGEVVVDGDKMVETATATATAMSQAEVDNVGIPRNFAHPPDREYEMTP